MAEIIINDVKYTNVPNKKAGTKFASALTQSNIGMSQAVQDYVNSSYFYALINAIDINWDGIDIGENTYINTTSDLIKWIESKAGDIDLSSYATVSYVNQKFEDLIGGAPETLDTLKELADALADDASLAYVTQALDGKADKSSLTNYATNSYVTTELDKKADKTDIPAAPDLTPYVTYKQANSYYSPKYDHIFHRFNDSTKGVDIAYLVRPGYSNNLSDIINKVYNVDGYSTLDNSSELIILSTLKSTSSKKISIGGGNSIIGGGLMNKNGSSYTYLSNGIFIGRESKIGQKLNNHQYVVDSGLFIGDHIVSNSDNQYILGNYNALTNNAGSTISFNVDTTMFAIGNGSSDNARHNAFEVRKNGNIYIADTFNGTPYSLQSRLNSKANANDVYTKTEVDNMIPESGNLSNYVSYTQANSYYVTVEGPKQIITGSKTFVGDKKINFRQRISTDKLGFTLYNFNEKEVGGLEWRPDTIGGRPLLSLQQYIGTGDKFLGINMGYLGFRLTDRYNSKYHLITPLPSDVNTIETINVGNDYRNFFFPLVFKNGSNKVYTDCTGLVDMASLMPDLNDYTTTSYVTTELNKKADLSDIPSAPDLTPYVTYADANSYYVAKEDMPDVSNCLSYSDANSYYLKLNDVITQTIKGQVNVYGQNGIIAFTNPNDDPVVLLQTHYEDLGGQYKNYALRIEQNFDGPPLYIQTRYGSGYNQKIVFPAGEDIVTWLGYKDMDMSYIPLAFTTNNTTYIKPNKAGLVNLSSIIPSTPDLSGYATVSYVTSELDKKADLSDIPSAPDLTPYVTYANANTYYVDINSYNALVARVEELASWIVSYHTPVIQDVSLWHTTDGSSTASYMSNNGGETLTLDISDSTTHTINFDSNVNDIVMSVNGISTGITVNNTVWPYSIQYTPSMMTEGGNYSFGFSRNMDSSYNAFSSSFGFNVESSTPGPLPQAECYWSGNNGINYGPHYNSPIWNAGESKQITLSFVGTPASGWTFTDPNITGITVNTSTGEIVVNPSIMLSKGKYDITASYAGDSTYSSNQITLTIEIVNYPASSWTSNGTTYSSEIHLNDTDSPVTLTFNGTPTSGWVFSDKSVSGVTVNTTTGEIYLEPSMLPIGENAVLSLYYPGDSTYSSIGGTFWVYVTRDVQKTTPSGVWSNISSLGKCIVVAGDTNTVTCTFSGTPASGWSINDPGITGINVDATNYTVTIDPTNMMTGNYHVYAEYPEDSSYNYNNMELSIRVLPSGSDVNFFFENDSYSLDNSMNQSMDIYIETTLGDSISWSSSDTGVCSIAQSPMSWNGATITYVSDGSATLTATIDDNGTTHTATCTVTCSSMTP